MNNWLYFLGEDRWQKISPILTYNKKDQKPLLISVYSSDEKLFVLLKYQDYRLYQLDITASEQWQFIKEFSLDSKHRYWHYLNNNTLYAYSHKFSTWDSKRNQIGYLQTLDLTNFKISTISSTPDIDFSPSSLESLISPQSHSLYILANDNIFYAYYNGIFYRKS